MRTALAIVVLAVVFVFGCSRSKKTLDPVYAEGGVVRGHGAGGESLQFTASTSATDPDVIGTAGFSKTMTTYTVRRSGPRYELLKDGRHAGTIEQNKNWITVTIDGEPPVQMRSDEPGFLM